METYMFTMVKNKCTKMYLNKLQLYFWYTKLIYFKSVKLEQLILYLMHFSYPKIVLKSN